jgi:hypothetical protein
MMLTCKVLYLLGVFLISFALYNLVGIQGLILTIVVYYFNKFFITRRDV